MTHSIEKYLEGYASDYTKFLPAKTLLLEEGKTADKLYLIRKGCLRLFFNHNGDDHSFQFFFEGEFVASFDSLYYGKPSLFSLETIEPSEVITIDKSHFFNILDTTPDFRSLYEAKLVERFSTYQQLFLSRIRDTPQQRYEELIKQYPNIIQRVPLCHIASYLGITSVSLSRIRSRI